MTHRPRAVSVKQLPEKLNARQGRLFFKQLESCMNVERPYIVLDCSKLREMDAHAIHLLLCCLEGAMKRNGDVCLACVAPGAVLNLELAGADSLFRVFDTVEGAVANYQHRVMPMVAQSAKGLKSSANAA